jgi:hypothetical protein
MFGKRYKYKKEWMLSSKKSFCNKVRNQETLSENFAKDKCGKFKKFLYLKDMKCVTEALPQISRESMPIDLSIFSVVTVWNLFIIRFSLKRYINLLKKG